MLPNTSAALDYHRQSGRAYGGIMPPPFGGTNGYQPYQVKGGAAYSPPLPVSLAYFIHNFRVPKTACREFPSQKRKMILELAKGGMTLSWRTK
jgi:hypothetical protein